MDFDVSFLAQVTEVYNRGTQAEGWESDKLVMLSWQDALKLISGDAQQRHATGEGASAEENSTHAHPNIALTEVTVAALRCEVIYRLGTSHSDPQTPPGDLRGSSSSVKQAHQLAKRSPRGGMCLP